MSTPIQRIPCPYCQEMIAEPAIRCEYCGSDLREVLRCWRRRRHAREAARLDPVFEQGLADEGFAEDAKVWPEY
jgi:hypothetical protein